MTVSIDLPRLIGTRDAARRLLAELNVPDVLRSERVCIDARDLSTATTSFTDELLEQLSQREALEIVVVRAPVEFREQVAASVRVHEWTNVRFDSLVDH